MMTVWVGTFKFGNKKHKLRYVLDINHKIRFVAKDIIQILKYQKCNRATANVVDRKYKIYFNKVKLLLPSSRRRNESGYLQPRTILLEKIGLIQMIMRSEATIAAELQNWFFEYVIPECSRGGVSSIGLNGFNVTRPVRGYFYVASTNSYIGKNLYKIGQTTNLERRLATLNCGRANFDHMDYVLYTKPITYFVLLEKMVKRHLKTYRNSGEVYEVDLEIVINIIINCIGNHFFYRG
ncbi:bro [Hemileuca sp. nucleopolyhedrovirus]|uniref:Bro n=1 Tax=Hemileuca sp. nucleopolyhedrovirus TaxID=1367203 RepID=S5MQI0_9ABAC|nr:bro [Hemileuca sp. nucleopolyhedrovirus]AGR56859.1 bro [Hemileuca sp. nucleopolyhedrovirus]